MSLRDKTIVVSGGSRGIGLSIAVRAARDGANIVLAAKTGRTLFPRWLTLAQTPSRRYRYALENAEDEMANL